MAKTNYERQKEYLARKKSGLPKKVRMTALERNRKYLYGITREVFNEMLKKQDNKCAICKLEKKLVVDHNHKNGKVRGLLCQSCNTAIGKFKDDTDILNYAINYLKDYI